MVRAVDIVMLKHALLTQVCRCVCACVCAGVQVCRCVCVCVCAHACMCACVHMCIHVCVRGGEEQRTICWAAISTPTFAIII